ncbi:MAG: hypothetical protein CL947_04835 [Epsilonproteobacteria bacterium]|nr:hypothetical protein [Campylobacterota bacterium]|tara:strand:+ start:5225 stop:6031 length:807 start_codon:yes stop_codon:yes gene_type:complete
MLFLYVWCVIQIVTESLPISSSGHVKLFHNCIDSFHLSYDFVSQKAIIDFLLHLPTFFILFVFFFIRWWSMLLRQPVTINVFFQQATWNKILQLSLFFIIADSIPVIIWLFDILPDISLTVGFIVTALFLFSLRYVADMNNRIFDYSYRYALLLGVLQSISLLPGISRFATTYVLGRWCGYRTQDAFATSFLIQMPLIAGACVKGVLSIRSYPYLMSNLFDFKFLFVILSASIVSYYALCWVASMMQRKKIWKFSWYMLLPITMSLFV